MTGVSSSSETAAPTGAPASAVPESAELPSSDPAAVPGSGRGPPAEWLLELTDGVAHTISLAVRGTELELVVDAVVTTRPLDEVSSLRITGGDADDAFTIDASVAALEIDVLFDGGAGSDTLIGPAPDTTWSVTGAGAGTVSGISFAGIENLTGAAGNEDTFVFEAGASLAGTIDGSARGFDTLVIAIPHAAITYLPTGPDSGSVVLDGTTTIAFAGLEPVSSSVTAADVTVTFGDTEDTVLLVTDTSGQLRLDATAAEISSSPSRPTRSRSTSAAATSASGWSTSARRT